MELTIFYAFVIILIVITVFYLIKLFKHAHQIKQISSQKFKTLVSLTFISGVSLAVIVPLSLHVILSSYF